MNTEAQQRSTAASSSSGRYCTLCSGSVLDDDETKGDHLVWHEIESLEKGHATDFEPGHIIAVPSHAPLIHLIETDDFFRFYPLHMFIPNLNSY